MTINTKSIVSITEANQNFSKVARLVDELEADKQANVSDEIVMAFSRKMMEKNKESYEVLSK